MGRIFVNFLFIKSVYILKYTLWYNSHYMQATLQRKCWFIYFMLHGYMNQQPSVLFNNAFNACCYRHASSKRVPFINRLIISLKSLISNIEEDS